eukprot:354988-Chlamydomonas_euryale.AAC.5
MVPATAALPGCGYPAAAGNCRAVPTLSTICNYMASTRRGTVWYHPVEKLCVNEHETLLSSARLWICVNPNVAAESAWNASVSLCLGITQGCRRGQGLFQGLVRVQKGTQWCKCLPCESESFKLLNTEPQPWTEEAALPSPQIFHHAVDGDVKLTLSPKHKPPNFCMQWMDAYLGKPARLMYTAD